MLHKQCYSSQVPPTTEMRSQRAPRDLDTLVFPSDLEMFSHNIVLHFIALFTVRRVGDDTVAL